MILSNVEIHKALDARRLIIDPEPLPRLPSPGQPCPYDTHSVDLRLGAKLFIPQRGPYSFDLMQPDFPRFLERKSTVHIIEKDRPFILDPNVFALGMTLERVALPIDVAVNLETNTCLAA